MRLTFLTMTDAEDVPVVEDQPYDSVQITSDVLRDEDGRTIAQRVMGGWLRSADGLIYTDIVVDASL